MQTSNFKSIIMVSLVKLLPQHAFKNPVMFVVWLGTLVSLLLSFQLMLQQQPFGLAISCSVILLFTLLFANFSEAFAEARGQGQAQSLKATRAALKATRISAGKLDSVDASLLKPGDQVLVKAGEVIPVDGEILKGFGTVNESAVTGESAAVLREANTDRSSVIAGTILLTGELVVQVSQEPGHSFLDKMIALVEGAERKKTPNEQALTVLLAALTMVFVLVVATLPPIASFLDVSLDYVMLIALLVCLIPTTIGGLLPAIGIAGMNRALQANVIAKSGKAVEVAGDIDTLLLDKTGTITYGDRQATEFLPVQGVSITQLAIAAGISSLNDPTPEGKSVLKLTLDHTDLPEEVAIQESIPFTAETRISGNTLTNQSIAVKGSADAIIKWALQRELRIPANLDLLVNQVAKSGGTPLVVAMDTAILGVVALTDVIKPGVAERFASLRALGVKTIMVTGDNPVTAGVIAAQAGVDDFVAEAKPEDKLQLIRQEQDAGRLVAMVGDGTNDAPALAQADIGLAMNNGTQAAKEAGNMVDLDSDPTKLLAVVEIGKQLLITRGALTTFSLANDVAKYFAIIPAVFAGAIPSIAALNFMQLHSPGTAVVSALIFNALIIPALIPLAMRGVRLKAATADVLLKHNMLIYGLGGVLVPFVAIKGIDMFLSMFL
ncbi:potassium-transporting ATPase subunit KdpB [Alkalimonas sp. MEB108]|uniref:Potassium-transporting ATPase ATP-binding subunit n=1 Tax=Alkalimonas cellulosilytica TaxID=3058395 RepID=A0ABU7J4Z9_9GAMM|nr:potassium-transporting ATPase subunit KdpB [Alkalimonas sp. MEB108]MEE2001350.1 potassium-transporting ATPase subunit KdpB [Alkalimonas sp. MEB108]